MTEVRSRNFWNESATKEKLNISKTETDRAARLKRNLYLRFRLHLVYAETDNKQTSRSILR